MSIISKFIKSPNLYLPSSTAKRRLLILLVLFFICLTIPLIFLVDRVYQQFQREMFYQYRDSAEQVIIQTNNTIETLIAKEENRPFTDYQFYKVAESPLLKQKGIELSPLSRLDGENSIPGMVGYFQVAPDGVFSSPILPSVKASLLTNMSLNIEKVELTQRLNLKTEIKTLLLSANLLTIEKKERIKERIKEPVKERNQVKSTPKPVTKKTSKIKLTDLRLNERYSNEKRVPQQLKSNTSQSSLDGLLNRERKRKARVTRQETILTTPKETAEIFMEQAQALGQASLPTVSAAAPATRSTQTTAIKTEAELDTFEEKTLNRTFTTVIGEIDPIQMLRSDSGHYFFYRRVWRDKKYYIQGFIVVEDTFLETTIKPIFMRGNFDSGLKLITGYNGVVTNEFQFREPSYLRKIASNSHTADTNQSDLFTPSEDNHLIYRSAIIDPFDTLEIVITASSIPLGPSTSIINFLVLTIVLITSIGLYALYRLGIHQIKLAEERLNFVSSVSHELKTPLTSILMYGEMLKDGMVHDESKKKIYYDFIYYESERLSRLISNILQLSKLGKKNNTLSPAYTKISDLLDITRSKVSTLTDRHKYHLNMLVIPETLLNYKALVDLDGYSQIVINLVDNAVKFSSDSAQKQVDIGFREEPTNSEVVCFYVRDFGPGIPNSQTKKIFDLFYRIGSEMTRTKPGTGIGLALVNELARAMNGRVDLINCNPGVEFQVYFQASK